MSRSRAACDMMGTVLYDLGALRPKPPLNRQLGRILGSRSGSTGRGAATPTRSKPSSWVPAQPGDPPAGQASAAVPQGVAGRLAPALAYLDLLGGRQLAHDALPELVHQFADGDHRQGGDDPEGDALGDLAGLLRGAFCEPAHLLLHAPTR